MITVSFIEAAPRQYKALQCRQHNAVQRRQYNGIAWVRGVRQIHAEERKEKCLHHNHHDRVQPTTTTATTPARQSVTVARLSVDEVLPGERPVLFPLPRQPLVGAADEKPHHDRRVRGQIFRPVHAIGRVPVLAVKRNDRKMRRKKLAKTTRLRSCTKDSCGAFFNVMHSHQYQPVCDRSDPRATHRVVLPNYDA